MRVKTLSGPQQIEYEGYIQPPIEFACMHYLTHDVLLALLYIFLEYKLLAQINQISLSVLFQNLLIDLLLNPYHSSRSLAPKGLLQNVHHFLVDFLLHP